MKALGRVETSLVVMWQSSFYFSFRIYNYEPLTTLKMLRANLYGKFVAIRGTVVRVSNIKPLCSKIAFICNSCGDTQSLALPDGKYTTPTKVKYIWEFLPLILNVETLCCK